MKNEKTFGRFLISKRMEHEISARQLAISLGISAVYICDIEKDRRPVTEEILEKLTSLLCIMEKDIVRAALRTAKKHNVSDKQWEDFIRRITKKSE